MKIIIFIAITTASLYLFGNFEPPVRAVIEYPNCSILQGNIHCGYKCSQIQGKIYCGQTAGARCSLLQGRVYCGMKCEVIRGLVYCGDQGRASPASASAPAG